MATNINVLLSTFPGLALPSTLCLSLPSTLSSHDLLRLVAGLLPPQAISQTYLITSDNRKVTYSDETTLVNLAKPSCAEDALGTGILSLRLTAPLLGGKGGFGSQLRAAGGRMSSRKRKQNAELASGSARNLDGRRLRTITEAKNLATYLATKPEMDRKEKEERRKRWEQIIELAEQREADMRAGKTADGRRKGLSEEWLQEKEDVGDSVKNAVKLAMVAAEEADITKPSGSGSDQSPTDSADDDSDEDPMELDEEEMLRLRKEAESGDIDAIWVLKNKLKIPSSYLPNEKALPRRFAGFDDDLSSEEESTDDGKDHDNIDSIELAKKGKAPAPS